MNKKDLENLFYLRGCSEEDLNAYKKQIRIQQNERIIRAIKELLKNDDTL